jgi:hypothetical protein
VGPGYPRRQHQAGVKLLKPALLLQGGNASLALNQVLIAFETFSKWQIQLHFVVICVFAHEKSRSRKECAIN